MKKLSLLIIGLIPVFTAFSAPDTSYYYGSNTKPVDAENEALIKIDVKQRSRKVFIVKTFIKEAGKWKESKDEKVKITGPGVIRIRDRYQSIFRKRKERLYTANAGTGFDFREYEGDDLTREGKASHLIPLHLEDTVKTYYRNGNLKSASYYENNQVKSNRNWLPDGSDYIDNIYFILKDTPEYSLGNANFSRYMLNGLKAANIDFSQINDEIVLGWVIMEDGSMEGLHMVSGKMQSLGQLMMNLILEMPGEWIPAKYEGEAVRYYMEIPFNFRADFNRLESVEIRDGILMYN